MQSSKQPSHRFRMTLPALLVALLVAPAHAQQADQARLIAERNRIEHELQQVAVVDRKVMVPMRDGTRMAADVYRPKDARGKVPVIFSRTPYNFNFWDVKLGAPRDMSKELDAVKRGYALVEMNERGHFFSEGNYEILGAPVTDGSDAIRWMASQPWANGKVGTTGCSSTAEWQTGGGRQRATRSSRPSTCRGSVPASARSARITNRATGTAAVPCRCCSWHGCTGSRTRSGRCFRPAPRRQT